MHNECNAGHGTTNAMCLPLHITLTPETVYSCTAGAEALSRGAKALEEVSMEDAVLLYRDAIDLYEQDGKETQASDVFRQAISLLIRSQKWPDAVSMLMRFGEACDAAGARSSQSKAYLGAMVVWLYAQNVKEAWQVSASAVCNQIGNYAPYLITWWFWNPNQPQCLMHVVCATAAIMSVEPECIVLYPSLIAVSSICLLLPVPHDSHASRQ